MKAVALLALLTVSAGASDTASPVAKVLQLLTGLESKITKEGEAAKKAFDELTAWCDDRSTNLGFDIKTGTNEVAELNGVIAKQNSIMTSLNTKIGELGDSIATNEADLKAATDIRQKEAADSAAEVAELKDIIDTLNRAIGVLQKELKKGGAAMLQLQGTKNLADAFKVMVQASVLSTADAGRLTALVQSSHQSDDSDSDLSLGAPDAAVYESHSGGIIDTVQDLLEKAQTQLDDARKKEVSAAHNFAMLEQSLEDEVKFSNKEMAEARKGVAESTKTEAEAQSDLAVTSKDLAADKKTLETLDQKCVQKSADYKEETKSRAEELKALAEAKKVIAETTGGAEAQSYGLAQTSFLQLSSGVDLAHFEAVRFVRDFARKHNSPELAQLASQMSAVLRLGTSGGEDPFAKVKGLISDLIKRLEETGAADATQKAYCDKELAESEAKKTEKMAAIEKLSTKIDQMSARSAQLKVEVADVEKSLAKLAGSQAEADKIRLDEQSVFVSSKKDLEEGIDGVRQALQILRDYYAKGDKAHDSAEGAGTSIIGLLEVVEGDFSKGLAQITTTEDSAKASYDQQTQLNKLDKTEKEQDVKYKTKEAVGLDKDTAEANSDRSGVQTELDSVLEYLAKLKDQCVAKAETYSQRAARRQAELDGLKQALAILEGEAVLIQQHSRRTSLRAHKQ